MSWFRASKKASTTPDYTGLQLQTSTSTLPIPIVWGETKIAGNVIWYDHWRQVGQGAGKGGLFSSPATSYVYEADVIIALCEGPISGIGEIWKDQSTYTLAGLGLTLFTGTTPQSTWGYIASAEPGQALAYQGTAYVCAASYNLGSGDSIGNHNFEIIGVLAGTGVNGIDADPALVIQDFLTNAQYGAGFASASINTSTLLGSGGDASLQTYCKAAGIAFSPALTDQEQGSSILARWLQICNCAAVWSGTQLKFIPYGDVAITAGTQVTQTIQVAIPVPVTPASGPTPPPDIVACPASEWVGDGGVSYAFSGVALTSVGSSTPTTAGTYGISPNGTYLFAPGDEDQVVAITYTYSIPVSYSPNLTPIYNLTDLDFVDDTGNKDPVQVTRLDPYTLPNIVRVECLSRTNQYGSVPVEARDQSQIDVYGPRVGSTITAHEICDNVGVGATVAQTILQRGLYVRAHFKFKLSWEYGLLEPMDIVTITDANLGLSNAAVRIVEIEEDDQGLLSVTAEELTVSISTPALYPTAAAAKSTPNQGVYAEPVNPPLIFEPPTQLSNGVAQLWLGASGGASGLADPNWGGCYVWLSYDNSTYSQIGVINQPLRQGTLTSSLALATGWDTTDTLAVGLAESGALLSGTSATSAQQGATLSLVGSELLAYETAVLTGANAYNLTGLARGLYGSSAAAHASGAAFARLDGAVFKYNLPAAMVGKTVYFKFQSFNIWGSGIQAISTCVAYSYAVLGSGVFIPAIISGFGAALTQDGAANGNTYTLAGQWTADPNSASYEVDYSVNSGSTWSTIYSGAAPQFSVNGFGYIASMWVRVKGINGAFSSASYTQITVTAPAQTSVTATNVGLMIAYDDIGAPLIEALHLDGMQIADDQMGAAMANALSAQSATNAVAAQVGALSAQVTINQNAQASALAALATLLEQVEATTAAGTAAGSLQFVAASSLTSGVSAAFEMMVSATGPTGAFAYAGLRAEALSNGQSQVVIDANQFIVENAGTKQAVFGTNMDGSLTIQGVTKIASQIVSNVTTSSGTPVLQIDFVNGVISFNA